MSFKDWESFAAPRISLPINGKTYELPEVPAKLGHELRLAQAGKPTRLQELTPEDEAAEFLGFATHRAMVADGVPDAAIARAVLVVITDWRLGRDAAEAVWEAGINPELLAAKLAAIVESQSTESTSSGEATTTPQPDYSSGTSSPSSTPRSKRKTPAKAASRGSKSQSSGD